MDRRVIGHNYDNSFFPMISVDVHPGGHGFDHCLNDHVYMASGGTSEITI